MAFSQQTWRESLRDIKVCLTANQAKLFHMGLKGSPARSTLSDALNLRDWRIYHALAQRLIVRARSMYASKPGVLDLDSSVYALDATTIDLCLSLLCKAILIAQADYFNALHLLEVIYRIQIMQNSACNTFAGLWTSTPILPALTGIRVLPYST